MNFSIGNKVTEKDIRDWLNLNDFDGQFAKISNLELFAITRPGWKQLFSFSMIAKAKTPLEKIEHSDYEQDTSPHKQYWGVVLDDERLKIQSQKTQIWLYETIEQQQTKLAETSIGMVAINRTTDPWTLVFIGIGAIVFFCIFGLISLLT